MVVGVQKFLSFILLWKIKFEPNAKAHVISNEYHIVFKPRYTKTQTIVSLPRVFFFQFMVENKIRKLQKDLLVRGKLKYQRAPR